ncbi:STAS domain-containing protein [Spongiactinospora sp. TRM90649]|uniref:STAS domain-containing protein n=1 Tax=Spongiactinospora sp. TRM90649 TaxID=3031114 RepID=UPI0023F80A42|nr:STAS domain-containing protein [Spongiactinospora sp. TRM90649]MDF5755171.1 STAS domain-containing protein [Spongiactinospora sp. TRM90649]
MAQGTDSTERFTMSISLDHDVIVARAIGELDRRVAEAMRRQVQQAWQSTPSAGLVLDFSKLTFCDSTGLSVLVLLLKHSRAEHSPLVLCNTTTRLERMLSITGLQTQFQVTPSVEQAIQAVKSSVRL